MPEISSDHPPRNFEDYVDGYDQYGYDRHGYDRDGYNQDGYNRNGYGRYGYGRDGRDRDGYNRDGYGWDGYGRDGYNRDDYDSDGYDRDGYDQAGYNRDGYDWDCYDRDGYSWDGYGRDGYNRDGYDRHGRDQNGYDSDGYGRDGRDQDGYDRDGYDENGYDQAGNYNYNYSANYLGSYNDSYNDNGNDDDDDDDDGDGDGDDDELLPYNYRPRFRFHGEGPAFYGMEIEVTSGNDHSTLQAVRDAMGYLGYLKEDGSVYGFELVTHPMSYDYAMASFPWNLLTELREKHDCRVNLSDNGIHVHVSRKAFSSPAHLYRWMKLIYRNQADCERIARRQSSWGHFNRQCRKAQVNHAKCEARKRSRGGRSSSSDPFDGTKNDRYNAINTTNEDTLEVRIFASTLNPGKAKKALQLVAASVEYTRGINAHDVCAHGAWTWGAFARWLTENRETYPELAEQEQDQATPAPASEPLINYAEAIRAIQIVMDIPVPENLVR